MPSTLVDRSQRDSHRVSRFPHYQQVRMLTHGLFSQRDRQLPVPALQSILAPQRGDLVAVLERYRPEGALWTKSATPLVRKIVLCPML